MPAAAATRHLCTPRRSCLMRRPGEKRGVTVRDRPLKGAWGMTALLFLFMLINFADKVVVGLAAVPLTRDLGLTPEQFGDIVQVWSTYESRHNPSDPTPFARGINSFQLLKDGDRYWVVNIFWDVESPTNPIPAKYLPK